MSTQLYLPSGLHPWARRLARWLLAALVLATLAPAVSRSLASGPPQDGLDWVELCTAQGMQWVRVSELGGGDASIADEDGSSALDRCGHCTLAAERFAPLLPVWPVLAAVAARWPIPDFFTQSPRSAGAPHAAARGPPLQA